MASPLDGPGQIKLATLDDALTMLQRVHAIVERMAIAVRMQQDVGAFRQQLPRAIAPLVGLLKPQFELIADQGIAMLLAVSRGASDRVRLRAMREAVAQIRMQIEISANKVREQHAIVAEKATDESA